MVGQHSSNRWLCGVALSLLLFSGCSTLETLNGIPAISASRVPSQFLGRSKADLIQISLSRLRKDPPKNYTLDTGDIIAVYIETILGNAETLPPFAPGDADLPPSIGFPVPVQDDGTIILPIIEPLEVRGLTLEEVHKKIRKAYTVDKHILRPGNDRILVSMSRLRLYRVMVVREEPGAVQAGAGGGGMTSIKAGTGHILSLNAKENDLLHALNQTGGFPGAEAEDEIWIYHGMFKDGEAYDREAAMQALASYAPCDSCKPPPPDAPMITKVPLRFFPESPPRFGQKEITLQTGDIVYIRSRANRFYYTSGLLGGGQQILPKDRDLDIMEAVAKGGGKLAPGSDIGFQAANNLAGGGGGGGFGGGGGGNGGGTQAIVPTRVIILRKTCNGQIAIRVNLFQAMTDPSQRILVQPDDIIILQYTCAEEIMNTALGLIRLNFLFNGFTGRGF